MLKPFSDRVSGLQPSAIREILKFTADPEVISFAAGNPAPEAFPEFLQYLFLEYMVLDMTHPLLCI